MASLRNLLDKPTEADIRRVPTYMGDDGYQWVWRGNHCGHGCVSDDSYNRHWHCTCWCVPDLNICRMKVELWGAGGQNSNWRCRSIPFPGASGEYKSRTICAANWSGRETGYFDGMCIQMVAALPRCCANCNGGCTGCWSYFCTENNFTMCVRGGCGGVHCGMCFCSSSNQHYQCMGCYAFDHNICNHYDMSTPGYNRASEGYPRNWCDIQKCCGGDGRNTSVPGCGCCYHTPVGSAAVHKNSNEGRNNCSWYWMTPYPAGLNSTHGGYMVQIGNTECCCSCWDCFVHQLAYRPGYFPGGSPEEYMGPIGSGGTTNGIGGGDSVCRCGGPGAGGGIRLTLYPDTSAG